MKFSNSFGFVCVYEWGPGNSCKRMLPPLTKAHFALKAGKANIPPLGLLQKQEREALSF